MGKNNDTKMKKYFYPNISKNEIIPKGYVASKSDHSKGSTIDLTLFNLNEGKDMELLIFLEKFLILIIVILQINKKKKRIFN